MNKVLATYLVLGGVTAVAVILILKKFGPDAIQAINPTNNDNIINQGFNSLYQGATGSDGTLGTDIYDILHVGENDEVPLFSGDGVRTVIFGDKDKTLFNFWK